jgi:hypothetical protein
MATPPDRRAARPQFPGSLPQRPQPASPALQQRAFAALMLALISLFGMVMLGGNIRRGLVVLAVTLIIGAAGLFLAITTMSQSRRDGSARPRFVILATVLAVAGTAMSALALTGFALFWAQISQYENCLSGANTVSVRSACDQQLNNSLQTSVNLLGRLFAAVVVVFGAVVGPGVHVDAVAASVVGLIDHGG